MGPKNNVSHASVMHLYGYSLQPLVQLHRKLYGDTLETLVQLDIHVPIHTANPHTHTHLTAWTGSRKESGVVGVETVGFNDTVSLRTLLP